MVHEMVGDEVYEFIPLGEYIVRAVGVCGGRPTFKYTRVEVEGILDRLAAGESVDNIVAGFNGRISREAILEAVNIAKRSFISSLPDLAAA